MGDGQGALQSALTHSVSRQRRPSCSPAHPCSTTSPWLFVTPLAAGRCACHTTGTRIGIAEGSFRSPRRRCNLVAHGGRRFDSPRGFPFGTLLPAESSSSFRCPISEPIVFLSQAPRGRNVTEGAWPNGRLRTQRMENTLPFPANIPAFNGFACICAGRCRIRRGSCSRTPLDAHYAVDKSVLGVKYARFSGKRRSG